MQYPDLRKTLTIDSGKVAISSRLLTANIDTLLSTCFAGQPITITQAVPGPDDGNSDTLVILGRSSFLNIADLPVELRASVDPAGNAHLVIRYTLLGANPGPNDWKFSASFPHLPQVLDWSRTLQDPTSVPLDGLVLANGSFIVSSHPQDDRVFPTIQLVPGINFISRMHPQGLVGIIDNLFGHGEPLTLHGTIVLPPSAPAMPAPQLAPQCFPWDGGAPQPPPGILLQAEIGRSLAMGGMSFDQTVFRIYSPITDDWLKANPTYEPVIAYGGSLHIPSAGIQVDALALMEPGAPELFLMGRFSGVSVGKLAHLGDLCGGTQLIDAMPDQFKQAGDSLGRLQVTKAVIVLDLAQPGITSISMVSIAVGMPDQRWTVWPEHFVISDLACEYTIFSPFKAARTAVACSGSLSINGVPVDICADSSDGFTVHARLGASQTIPLKHLLQTYVPEVPPPGDLVVNSLAISIAPGRSYAMALAMAAQPTPWIIDVGCDRLTISDAHLSFEHPADGRVSGAFGGTIAFGDAATLKASYAIPGSNLAIRGDFAAVRLSEILAKLVHQTAFLPHDFDLNFGASHVLIEKKGDNYAFKFGSSLPGVGLFALEVRKTADSWGFAAGLDLSTGQASKLAGLSELARFEEKFGLEKLLLIIATFEDPDFSFPDLACFNAPALTGAKLSLNGTGGLHSGFKLYGEWVFNSVDQQQRLLTQLLGLKPRLDVTLQVGVNPATDASLFVSYQTVIEKMPMACTFGGRIKGESLDLFLEGTLATEIQGQKQTFDMILDFVENGALITCSMVGSTPIDFESFKLGDLSLVIGCNWEGIPSLGVAGTIEADDIEASIAVFFDSAEPQKSVVAGSLSDLTLKQVLDGLAGQAGPSAIDAALSQVEIRGTCQFTIPGSIASALDQLHIDQVAAAFKAHGIDIPTNIDQIFLVVDKPGTQWFLTDRAHELRHYQLVKQGDLIAVSIQTQFYCAPQATTLGKLQYDPGFYLTGDLHVFGFNGAATVRIEGDKGIAVDARMDRLVIGNETLFSVTAALGDGGPIISAATFDQPEQADPNFRPPHFYINGNLEILGISSSTYISLTPNGFEFESKECISSHISIDIKGHFNGLANMGIDGHITVNIDKINLGPLGVIDLGAHIEGDLNIAVNGTKISAAFDADFEFAGKKFDMPLALDVEAASLLNLPKLAQDEISKLLNDHLLKDAEEWANHVAQGLIEGVENTKAVLASTFKATEEEAQRISDSAAKAAQDAIDATAKAAKDAEEAVAKVAQDAANAAAKAAKDAEEAAAKAAQDVANAAAKAAKDAEEAAAKAARDAANAAAKAAQDAANAAARAAQDAANAAAKAASDAANAVSHFFHW